MGTAMLPQPVPWPGSAEELLCGPLPCLGVSEPADDSDVRSRDLFTQPEQEQGEQSVAMQCPQCVPNPLTRSHGSAIHSRGPAPAPVVLGASQARLLLPELQLPGLVPSTAEPCEGMCPGSHEGSSRTRCAATSRSPQVASPPCSWISSCSFPHFPMMLGSRCPLP